MLFAFTSSLQLSFPVKSAPQSLLALTDPELAMQLRMSLGCSIVLGILWNISFVY